MHFFCASRATRAASRMEWLNLFMSLRNGRTPAPGYLGGRSGPQATSNLTAYPPFAADVISGGSIHTAAARLDDQGSPSGRCSSRPEPASCEHPAQRNSGGQTKGWRVQATGSLFRLDVPLKELDQRLLKTADLEGLPVGYPQRVGKAVFK